MATYNLILPAGLITFRNGIYRGSHTEAVWSPQNPLGNDGWKDGDILAVMCTINANPKMPNPPPAREYAGLCAGACKSSDEAAVNRLIHQAKNLPLRTPGQLLGTGITTGKANDSAIFYNAKPTQLTFKLSGNRGELKCYTYQWHMIYNGSNTVADGKNVEIVFGYGDPMDSEVNS